MKKYIPITIILSVITLQTSCRHIPELQKLDVNKTSFRSCKNYFNQDGVCVSRNLCQSLPGINLTNKRFTFWEFLIMDGHYCGDIEDFDSVCCHITQVINQVMDINETSTASNTVSDRFLPVPGELECGFVVTDRIARQGTRTKLEEFPWLALLQYTHIDHNGQTQVTTECSGVLINNRYVLTAAHCLTDYERIHVQLKDVRLGDWNTSSSPDCLIRGITKECANPEQNIEVEKIIIHPDFLRTGNSDKDIALIRLARPVNFSIYVKPICLPLSGEDTQYGSTNEGKRFDVAGWQNGAYDVKQTAEVRGTSMNSCKQIYGMYSNDEKSICALSSQETDFTDNGGPLMAVHSDGKGNNYYYIAGISSYINNRPDLAFRKTNTLKEFTRVSRFVDWIQKNIQV